MHYVCAPDPFDSLEGLRRVVYHFSIKNPNVIPRSYMMLCLYASEKAYGRHAYTTWLSASMVAYGVPTMLLTSTDGSSFAARCLKPLFETIRFQLHQPSRQRQRLEFMLEDWGILQQQANLIDESFATEMMIPVVEYPSYFSGWVLEQTLCIMMRYIALGLELDLYDEFEYPYVFWYLDCIITSRIRNLSIIASFMEQLREHSASSVKLDTASGSYEHRNGVCEFRTLP